jgi:hypothetical protein
MAMQWLIFGCTHAPLQPFTVVIQCKHTLSAADVTGQIAMA